MTSFLADATESYYFIIGTNGVYIVTCLLNIIASLKIWKWLTIPYILLEGIRLIGFLVVHVVIMMVFKKQWNLGVLIAGSCAGGFFLLFLGYLWSCSIALFQMINVTSSKEYKKLASAFSSVDEKPPRNLTISSIQLNSKQIDFSGDKMSAMLISDFSEFYRKPPIYQY